MREELTVVKMKYLRNQEVQCSQLFMPIIFINSCNITIDNQNISHLKMTILTSRIAKHFGVSVWMAKCFSSYWPLVSWVYVTGHNVWDSKFWLFVCKQFHEKFYHQHNLFKYFGEDRLSIYWNADQHFLNIEEIQWEAGTFFLIELLNKNFLRCKKR